MKITNGWGIWIFFKDSISVYFIRLNILKIRVIYCEVLLSLSLLYNYLAWLAIIKMIKLRKFASL